MRERLSYRALDVEQIGSVYETVMGFTVEVAAGRALAIKAGKHNRTPVFVDLEEAARRQGQGPHQVPQRGGGPHGTAFGERRQSGGGGERCGRACRGARSDRRRARLAEEARDRGWYADLAADRRAAAHRQSLHADGASPRRSCDTRWSRHLSGLGPEATAGADTRSESVRSGHGLRRLPGRGLPRARGKVSRSVVALPREEAGHSAGRGRGTACPPPGRAALPLWRR